jgi:hypothetical protein
MHMGEGKYHVRLKYVYSFLAYYYWSKAYDLQQSARLAFYSEPYKVLLHHFLKQNPLVKIT